MIKKYNKGEWSEFYVFIKLLCEKKIYFFDSKLNKTNKFYKILNIYRNEEKHFIYSVELSKIVKNDEDFKSTFIIDENKLKPFIKKILTSLTQNKGSSFSIEYINEIFKIIKSNHIKLGSSYDKSDIVISIDDNNFKDQKIGFNIKSYLGNPPTLLNSSLATNFKYEIEDFRGDLSLVNNIFTKNKIRDRLIYLKNKSAKIKFIGLDNDIFNKNLCLIDSQMSEILSVFLLNFYLGNGNKINQISKNYQDLFKNISSEFVIYKVQTFLLNIALGMVPSKAWDGYDNANGYIILKKDGEVGCFDILNKKILAQYLFDNTRFDTPSSSRHRFGILYMENGKFFIKLNLQIRFENF